MKLFFLGVADIFLFGWISEMLLKNGEGGLYFGGVEVGEVFFQDRGLE